MIDIGRRNTEYLFIWQDGVFRKIAVDEVMYLEASGNYCYVMREGGKGILLSITLLKAGKAFPPEQFVRVSRSHIVNIRCVDAICGNTLYIGKKEFTVSPSHRRGVLRHFSFLGSSSRKLLQK